MQPYFFPYIGYFQLIKSVDKFVFYDDVHFIKQGWINRNRILMNGQPCLISVPVKNISSFCLISETAVSYNPDWRGKFLKSIQLCYGRSPFFREAYSLVERIVSDQYHFISEIAVQSVLAVLNYLRIEKAIVPSSGIYQNNQLKAQDRILDICEKEKSTAYINLPGGRELYSQDAFNERKITLQFIKPRAVSYPQFKNEFVPSLSIIDVLMFNPPEKVLEILEEYDIIY